MTMNTHSDDEVVNKNKIKLRRYDTDIFYTNKQQVSVECSTTLYCLLSS